MTDKWLFALFFSMSAIGINSLNLCSQYCNMNHFPESKGKVTGFYLVFVSLSGALFAQIIFWLMNPKNIQPDNKVKFRKTEELLFGPEVFNKLPDTLRILALIWFTIAVIGATLISFPKKQELDIERIQRSNTKSLTEGLGRRNSKPEIKAEILDEFQIENSTKTTVEDASPEKTLYQSKFWTQPNFWCLFFCTSFTLLPGYYVLFRFKQYGLKIFKDDYFMTKLSSIAFLFAGLCRFLFGLLFDKFGYKKVAFCIQVLLFVLVGSLPFVTNQWVFLIWICFILAGEGGIIVISHPVILKVYGIELGSLIMPYKNTFMVFAQFINMFISGEVKEEIGEEAVMIYVLPAFLVIGGIFNLFINENGQDFIPAHKKVATFVRRMTSLKESSKSNKSETNESDQEIKIQLEAAVVESPK
eukprot:TRINITY_DN1289_c0_g1_i16.p1 TRINITY_DN1289_c0_g1~~TRINITY_DN1289_c0_g1_i16.p1  ORF type:complete len:415 (+),score=30.95 TRINITY_DN1289_c0_g1_i16:414-1658(+)